jgi:hypothetical protein
MCLLLLCLLLLLLLLRLLLLCCEARHHRVLHEGCRHHWLVPARSEGSGWR